MTVQTYIRLRGAELELDETNASLLHSEGAASVLQDWLCKDQTIYQLAVLNSSSYSSDDTNVVKIHILGSLDIDRLSNGVDGHGAEKV
jgi:hypothetical protein